MFGISGTELFLILLFAFLIFGPEKLPQIGRTIGRAVRQFRNAQDEMNRVVRTEIYDPIMDDEPLKNPAEILTGKKKTDKRKVKTVDEGTGTETFAERRARLARERAEREAAAAEHGDATAAPDEAADEAAESTKTSSADSGARKANKQTAPVSASSSHSSAKTAADKPARPASGASGTGTETFAERRARLARERQARERQAAARATSRDRNEGENEGGKGKNDKSGKNADGPAAPQADATQPAGRSVADALYGVKSVDAGAKGGDGADKA